MNFRDRLIPQKEEDQSYIKFVLDEDWANLESYCSKHELANFLGNLVDIAKRIIKDEELPDEWADRIYHRWRQDMRDLPGNKKKC